MAKEYIEAMQSEGAAVCVKHFCCNNLEDNRFEQSSEVEERTLHEIYYKPFEIACKAKPLSIMSSYNRINGVYGSEYKKGTTFCVRSLVLTGLSCPIEKKYNNRYPQKCRKTGEKHGILMVKN